MSPLGPKLLIGAVFLTADADGTLGRSADQQQGDVNGRFKAGTCHRWPEATEIDATGRQPLANPDVLPVDRAVGRQDEDDAAMLTLEPEMTYRVKTTHPLETTHGSPLTPMQYWQVSEASLSGPRIEAMLAATGCDWMRVSPDGFWRPDVRAQFLTDDGAVVFMHYTGLVQQTDAFKKAAAANRATDWPDQYMRLSIRFDAGAEGYRWLNQSLFVAAGRLLGTGSIEYAVYRVT